MASGDWSFTIAFRASAWAAPREEKLQGRRRQISPALAFCNAGITVRMLTMPTCGLFFGSGKLPVAQPSNAGAPAHLET